MLKSKYKHFTAVLVVLMFLLGYSTAKSAAIVVTYQPTAVPLVGGCQIPPLFPPVPCSQFGNINAIFAEIMAVLRGELIASMVAVETTAIATLAVLVNYWTNINLRKMEFDLASHWSATWANTVLDNLQDMGRQQSVKMADSSRINYSNIDAQEFVKQQVDRQMHELKIDREHRVSESAAVAGTVSESYARANAFSQGVRKATDRETSEIGANKIGTPGSNSILAFQRQRFQEYKNLFCNPQDNGGRNNCGSSDSDFYNADTRPTQFIYNKLTIPVNPDKDTEGKMSKTIEHINMNMFGTPVSDPVSKSALQTTAGQEELLNRRAHLARHGAVRSVQNLVTGWRMPGSRAGEWIGAIRQTSGIPTEAISTNPSYKEMMHAMTVDRFNSGAYSRNLISDENNIEMEKLVLDTLYLMQLRDYYELLERTALVLSMQVIMLSEEQSTSNAVGAAPIQ